MKLVNVSILDVSLNSKNKTRMSSYYRCQAGKLGQKKEERGEEEEDEKEEENKNK